MIELSLIDAVLLCWAGVATGTALHYKSGERAAKMFIKALLSNKDLRDKVVAEYEEFQRSEA